MDTNNDQMTIRDYPLVSCFIGIAGLLIALVSYMQKPLQATGIVIGGGIFLITFLFASIMTLTIDRTTSTVTLRHTGLVSRKVREIPIADVAAVEMERPSTTGSNRSSGTYRIAIITRDEKSIPLHSYYTNGSFTMQKRVKRLREFLGVGGLDYSPGSIMSQGIRLAQQVYQEQQETLTGSEVEEHITDGVHWRVQTSTMGATPVTRWVSPDFTMPGGFIFLAQKAEGQKTPSGGILGSLEKLLFQQAIGLYGFSPEDTPGLADAKPLEPLDAVLEPHFFAFTNNAASANHILSPQNALPLADWATRYPLKQIQKTSLFGQLGILFSPRGVYLTCQGTLIPEALEELTNLGVAIVKGLSNTAV